MDSNTSLIAYDKTIYRHNIDTFSNNNIVSFFKEQIYTYVFLVITL